MKYFKDKFNQTLIRLKSKFVLTSAIWKIFRQDAIYYIVTFSPHNLPAEVLQVFYTQNCGFTDN